MSGWRIFGMVAAVLAGIALAANARDVARYIKIRSM